METHNVQVEIGELEDMVDGWIVDAESRQHSTQTIDSRRLIMGKFVWWIRREGLASVGAKEIRQFLAYVGGEAPPGGRWGNPHETGKNCARTVETYWERLRTLFRWGIEEGMISLTPMANVKRIAARRDQVQPFTEQQIRALLAAAGRSRHPLRDRAIILFMLDCGVRASEVCTLVRSDLDLVNSKATVLGKGNKRRPVYFSDLTREALREYVDREARPMNDTVFHGERGPRLTRSGLLQLIHRLGRTAGLMGVRCSPHTFRHTAAIWSIRNGMDSFTLQTMLGHTDLTMTRRYVAVEQADLEGKHRLCSPVRGLAAAEGWTARPGNDEEGHPPL